MSASFDEYRKFPVCVISGGELGCTRTTQDECYKLVKAAEFIPNDSKVCWHDQGKSIVRRALEILTEPPYELDEPVGDCSHVTDAIAAGTCFWMRMI